MRVDFNETFDLPVDQLYGYFKTPADWPRLYGAFGDVQDRGEGWYAVPMKGSPFPLVAKIVVNQPGECVSWIFRGFWRGAGEVRFVEGPTGVTVEGFEDIAVRPLWFLSPVVERAFLERRFRSVWNHGWRRLRATESDLRETESRGG